MRSVVSGGVRLVQEFVVEEVGRFFRINQGRQWGRSRTFYISSYFRPPSFASHRTHFDNIRTNPQMLPM